MKPVVKVTGEGVDAASLAENVETYRERYRENLGADLSQSPYTPQEQITGPITLANTEIGEGIVRVSQGLSVDHAQGAELDALGSLLEVERVEATKSRVTATLTGVAGTGVPAGSRARTAAGDQFATLADAVLSPAGVQVEMESVEDGAIEAAAGTLTRIVTVIGGWETVTNASAAVLGRERQTDADYRASYEARTARSAVGPMSALKAALTEALAGKVRVEENNTAAAVVTQEASIGSHSILVIAESGSDGDVRRAVENHRGMGVGTTVAIRGGTPDNSALDSVSSGSIIWNGTTYTGLDLSSAATAAAKAAALSTLLAMAGVVIRSIDGVYFAFYGWSPNSEPAFGDVSGQSVADNFGLLPADAVEPAGPFMRTRERELTVTAAVTRRSGFPSDGLTQIRQALFDRVAEYEVGEQVWLNDLLCAVEAIAGTRVTSITAQHDSADVSGVAVPIDILWSLPTANLTVTLT